MHHLTRGKRVCMNNELFLFLSTCSADVVEVFDVKEGSLPTSESFISNRSNGNENIIPKRIIVFQFFLSSRKYLDCLGVDKHVA